MAKSNTLLKALLGMAVVAGWQNRDKIGEFVKNLQTGNAGGSGLGDLVDSFRKSGLGQKAESWVGTGQNETVSPAEVEKGVGGDIIDELAQQTGVSREELLKRLSDVLPGLVDNMTPAGKLPA
jgi:uncharacterized protein YidB (DUF937 family)